MKDTLTVTALRYRIPRGSFVAVALDIPVGHIDTIACAAPSGFTAKIICRTEQEIKRFKYAQYFCYQHSGRKNTANG